MLIQHLLQGTSQTLWGPLISDEGPIVGHYNVAEYSIIMES